MALIGLFGAVTLVVLATLWASVKLTRYWINSEQDGVMHVLEKVWTFSQLGIVSLLLYAFAPGVAAWLQSVWAMGVSLL